VYFHQLGVGRDAHQFLDEALEAASRGVVSVLLDGNVPWGDSWSGTVDDRERIDAQMSDLRRAVAVLKAVPGVDPKRLAFVGHDYGAMFGALLSAEDTPVSAFVLMAAAPEFGDWLSSFNRDPDAKIAYPAILGDRSPTRALAQRPSVPRLLQFAQKDDWVPTARADLLTAAAPLAEVRTIDSSHNQIFVDGKDARQSWLYGRWGLRPPGPDLVPTIEVHGKAGNYRLGTTELTQGQWKAVTGTNQSWFSKKSTEFDQHPVEMVNWYQAVAFCNQLSAQEGLPAAYLIGQTVTLVPGSRGWRLPTSAEWEWAAQGGALSHHTDYAGSNNLDEVGWTWDNAAETTHPVAQKKPNELGFYDMSGNVREWCWDIGMDETSRVYRGGGFISGSRFLRIGFVDDFLATYLNNDNGLRIARTVD
jgi:hypothetical protein